MVGMASLLLAALHLLCAGGAIALAGWLLARQERGVATLGKAASLTLTACWALASFGLGDQAVATTALLSLSYLAWLAVLYRLFAHDDRDKSVAPIRPVVWALALVELLQLTLLGLGAHASGSSQVLVSVASFAATLRLLFCIGALMLVHNLYAGASSQARQVLGWPAAALAVIWLYDLNLFAVAYLSDSWPPLLIALRAAAVMLAIAMLAIGAMRHVGNLRFQPSRTFAFRSVSLLIIGGYLLAMFLAGQSLAYFGGELARVMQAGVVALLAAMALTVLPSRRVRGWLRVMMAKHLFQHRYDYRNEWLRFTDTMGRAGPSAAPLRERIVKAVADITDSPRGLLLTPGDDGELALTARWEWPDIKVPAIALEMESAQFFEDTHYIVELGERLNEDVAGVAELVLPDWLKANSDAWALVPLLHFERLVGVVVLGRPPLGRRLDWEDFDLLRVIGRQLASYLAEQTSQDALGEASSFDEFHRRIAFVMHDIKNLASQMSLLARNAEKHANNPAFRADMLVTLRSSTDKLQSLLDRLGRYGSHSAELLQPVALDRMIANLVKRYEGQHQVIVVDSQPLWAVADCESLEQALVHLLQNAIEASAERSPVFLALYPSGDQAVVEIIDNGSGMNAEFVRSSLFKPFHSSKPGGFGIGAYEARELVRAMGGGLGVESREGLGTRFFIRLPLASDASLQITKVA